MDVVNYMKTTRPKAKRSKLVKYLDEILVLNANGYSNLQVQDWLGQNGVQVSQETVRQFINKQKTAKGTETAKPSGHQANSTVADERKTTTATPGGEGHHSEEESDNQQTIFNPSDLRTVLSEKVDLNKLAKIGRELRRKKKHEERGD